MPEPCLSLQVYTRQNYLLHDLPYYLGDGKGLTKENKNKIQGMNNWLQMWTEAREMTSKRKPDKNNNTIKEINDIEKYKPPRKKIYQEHIQI